MVGADKDALYLNFGENAGPVLNWVGLLAFVGICVFIYAFATLTGGVAPGGLGISDSLLAFLAAALFFCPGIEGAALETCVKSNIALPAAASVLIRICTLWIGVAIGAVALFKVSRMLGGSIALGSPAAGEE